MSNPILKIKNLNVEYPLFGGILQREVSCVHAVKNLSIDIANTINLIKNIPNEFIIVAESGIKTRKDIDIYNELGVYNFLIGESLLKAPNIELKIKELLD